MATVAALYRHPVKGLTPESLERLTVLDGGAVDGDRVLGFVFAGDRGEPSRGDWWKPDRFVALKTTPGLTRLDVRLDTEASRLSIRLDGETLVETTLDAAGRERIAAAMTNYVLTLDESPLRDHPERAPLRLIGDLARPVITDRAPTHISVIGRASIEALAGALGAEVDERRFRANVIFDSAEPWEELGWTGRPLRIGSVEFKVEQPIVRCVATHANPESGERDLAVLNTLTSVFGHERPTMGVLATPIDGGGELTLGDAVQIAG
jgi:hypothetical protein